MYDTRVLNVEHMPKELTKETSGDRRWHIEFPIPSEGIDLEKLVDQFTGYLIEKAMRMTDGNISQAAKLLGTPRGTLRYKLKKLDLDGGA